MRMEEIINKLSELRVVPVIAIDDAEKAVPLAGALTRGGLPCAEITFRTAQAEEAMRRIAKHVPELLLGAGTVLTTEQADRAANAGAKFVVTPGFNPRVVDHCISRGIPIIPGCSTPSDMEQAIERGLRVVKFFPAEQSGGLAYIKAVSAPYSMLSFMPTGGISPKNLKDYLSFNKIFACGGSWMVKKELISEGRFDEIERLCAEAYALARSS